MKISSKALIALALCLCGAPLWAAPMSGTSIRVPEAWAKALAPVYRAGFESPIPALSQVNLEDGVSRACLAPAVAYLKAKEREPEQFLEQPPERRKELWQEALRNAQSQVKIEARTAVEHVPAVAGGEDDWRVSHLHERLSAFQGPLSVYLDADELNQVNQARQELFRLESQRVKDMIEQVRRDPDVGRIILHPALWEHEAYQHPRLWRAQVRFGLLSEAPLKPSLPRVAAAGITAGTLMGFASFLLGHPSVGLSALLGVSGLVGAVGVNASAAVAKMIYEHHLGPWPGGLDRLASKSARYGLMASLAGFTAALGAYLAALL